MPTNWNEQVRSMTGEVSRLSPLLRLVKSSIELPEKCDVLVIGSGYSGTATAYHILKDNLQPPSVVLLEARQICSGATGRNGGHIKPDAYFGIPRYSRIYGAKAAADIVKFETSQVLAVKDLVERERLDCDFHLTSGIDVYLDEDLATQTADAYRKVTEAGAVDVRDVAYTGPDDAERISGVNGAKACFSFTAGHLFPKKMVEQLIERLIPMGLQVYTHTAATCVSDHQDEEGCWIVETNRGTIRARKVIFCTNAYTPALLPRYQNKIIPVRGVCSRITTPRGKDSPYLTSSYTLRFDNQQYDYLIPRADGSIIVGGARKAFWHIKESWYGNTNDGELIGGGSEYFDGYMQKLFRGWEDGEASLEKIWTGIMGYSSDFVPHLGQVPDNPDQFIIAGFSGHGMPQIWLASQGVARMVTDKVAYEQTGLPAVFKTTNERLDSTKNELEKGFENLWKPSRA